MRAFRQAMLGSAAVLCAILFVTGYLTMGQDANQWLGACTATMAVGFLVAYFGFAPPGERLASAGWLSFGGFFAVILTAVVFPVFLSARQAGRRVKCIDSARQLALGVALYSSDNDDRFPPADRWRTLTELPAARGLRCPAFRSPWTNAMNARMATRSSAEIDVEATILVFEAAAYQSDAAGGKDWFATIHGKRGMVGFADGHAKLVGRNWTDVKWSP